MTQPAPESGSGQQALADALEQSFRLLRVAVVLLVLAYLGSGVFIVGQQEKAMVLVFGKARGLPGNQVLAPGFHWTWPRPVSEIVRFPAERIQDLATDTYWYNEAGLDPDPRAIDPQRPLAPGRDGYNLSGDANIFHTRWTLRYRVRDLRGYLFSVGNPEPLLRRELDRAIARASAGLSIDDALRMRMDEFRSQVERELRARMPALGLGIAVEGVDLTDALPPRQVLAAFNDVIDAEQEQSRQISEARAYATRTVNEARGGADRIRSEGQADARRRLDELRADADAFTRIRATFTDDRDTVLAALQADAVRRALARTGQRFVIPADPEGKQELRLQIGKPASSPAGLPATGGLH